MTNTTEKAIRAERPGAAAITLSGYRLLRIDRAGWRLVLDGLVRPAFRLHRFRNARTRMWLQAICEQDCSGSLSLPAPGMAAACGDACE